MYPRPAGAQLQTIDQNYYLYCIFYNKYFQFIVKLVNFSELFAVRPQA